MPTKEDTRRYISERAAEHKPPPSVKEIRRRLGWELIEAERQQDIPPPSDLLPKVD